VAGEGELSQTQATCEWAIDRRLNHDARILVASIVAVCNFLLLRRKDGRSHDTRTDGLPAEGIGCRTVLRADGLLRIFCRNNRLETVRNKLVFSVLPWAVRDSSPILTPRWRLRSPASRRSVPKNDVRSCHSNRAVWSFPSCPLCASRICGYLTPNDTLLFGFTPLILGGGVIGLVIGFLPLFRFHLVINKYRDEWTWELKDWPSG
jgi:hypothetical protein